MNKFLSFLFILILSLIIISPAQAKSAFLYLYCPDKSFDEGEEFLVSIKVSTDFPINTIKTNLYFPQDKLSVMDISKAGSIFTLWPQEPKFSNDTGIISFIGGVPSPGFTGTNGQIISIRFKAISSGIAKLNFGESAILANDGHGTDIFSYAREVNYIVKKLAPIILSSTHHNEESWYSNNNLELQWELSPDISAISFILDKNPETEPDIISEGDINSKTYEGLSDGIWYFHLRTKDADWSSTRHFVVHIDKTPPLPFEISVNNEGDPTNPQPLLYFKASDEVSGIDHYQIKLETGDNIILANPSINQYRLSIQGPGNYSIVVSAFDKAGNSRENIAGIVIRPIEKPTIVLYPTTYIAGEERFYAEGTALPKAEVELLLEKNNNILKSWQTLSDINGDWSFSTAEILHSGTYYLFGRAKDARGAISDFSPKHEVEVKFNGIAIGPILITFRNLALGLVIVLLILVILATRHLAKSFKVKKILKKETKEAEESLRAGFSELKQDIIKELEKLEGIKSKRELNEKEKEILENLKEDLRKVENVIGKEIKDIDKNL